MKEKNNGYFQLEKSYKYTLNAIPRGRLESRPITNSCNIPWRTITIDDNLNCILCSCDGWLPIPVGQVFDFDTIEQVFQSNIAKIIQTDIEHKKYTWCAVQNCGIKNHDNHVNNYEIVINIDRSCNLQCPSCRREKYLVTSGEIYDKKIKASEQILQWLEKFDHSVNIITSGDGDPLASLIMRPIIKNWKPKSNQNLTLKTNGLLIKKQLNDINLLNNISNFSISIDAGSQEVYEKVRLGGSWKVLIENFNFLKENKRQAETCLDFVIQNNNYEDLENFILLCEQYQFKGTVSQLDNWGTWNNKKVLEPDQWTQENGYFFDHDVLKQTHPNYNRCKKIVQKHLTNPLIGYSPAVLERLNL